MPWHDTAAPLPPTNWLASLPKQWEVDMCSCGKVFVMKEAGPFTGSLRIRSSCDECKDRPKPVMYL